MKKYRLYIEEDTYIDMTPEGLDNLKNVNVQYDGKELAGKQLEVTYKELKYPIIIITPPNCDKINGLYKVIYFNFNLVIINFCFISIFIYSYA